MRYCIGKIGVFTLLVLLALLGAPAENARASAYQNWTGVWSTNRGELRLQQTGRAVSGAYCADSGLHSRLTGTFTDEWGFGLRGDYAEGIEAGAFEFRMVESNEAFRGWLHSPENVWTGRRTPAAMDEAKQQELTIVNNSPYPITAIFVCPADSEDWREVLGGAELAGGRQRNVVFSLAGSVCGWDIKVVEASGNFTTFQSQRIKPDFTSMFYYYRQGSGQIQFAVG